MVSWTGLSSGIERGVRIAHSMDENERRNQEMDDRMQDRAQRRILTDMQIDQYKDQNKRQEDLRNMRMAKEGLVHLKGDNRETFLKSYNASPESFSGMDAGMDRAGQIYADMITEQQGDGLKRDFKRLIPLDGGKLAVEFTVTKPDGSTYEAPATINSSADPKDQVVALTLDDLGGYLSALEAEITSLDTQMVGLGDTSAIDKREQAAARVQGIADKMDMADYENRLGIQRDAAKAKASAVGKAKTTGEIYGWKPKDAETFIKSTVATGMGLNNDMMQWNADQEKDFSTKSAAVLEEWRANPGQGILGAYRTVVGSELPGEAFNAMTDKEQAVLIDDHLRTSGVEPEGSGMLDFGEKDFSDAQKTKAKMELSHGVEAQAEKSTPKDIKKQAEAARSDPAAYEKFLRDNNPDAPEKLIQEQLKKKFNEQAQAKPQQPKGISVEPQVNNNAVPVKKAQKLIAEVDKLINSTQLTPSLARAQLNRLSQIADAGYSNFKLSELRRKLESIAMQDISGISGQDVAGTGIAR